MRQGEDERRLVFIFIAYHLVGNPAVGDGKEAGKVPFVRLNTFGQYLHVVDLGGNDVGTMVLGRMKPLLDPAETDFFMVVNTYRPNTSTPEGVIEQMENLEYASGLKVTGFINNTNLVRETTAQCLVQGDAILREVTQRTGVPVKYVTYVKELLTEGVPEGLAGELFPMEFNMRKTWM